MLTYVRGVNKVKALTTNGMFAYTSEGFLITDCDYDLLPLVMEQCYMQDKFTNSLKLVESILTKADSLFNTLKTDTLFIEIDKITQYVHMYGKSSSSPLVSVPYEGSTLDKCIIRGADLGQGILTNEQGLLMEQVNLSRDYLKQLEQVLNCSQLEVLIPTMYLVEQLKFSYGYQDLYLSSSSSAITISDLSLDSVLVSLTLTTNMNEILSLSHLDLSGQMHGLKHFYIRDKLIDLIFNRMPLRSMPQRWLMDKFRGL